jgi:hypothetical protein
LSKPPHKPNNYLLPTLYNVVESEESSVRFQKLFQSSFRHFDANSTTNPFSTIQRTYFNGLNASDFLPLNNFSSLIRGASFVASTCHRGGGGSTKRVSVMFEIKKNFRVDSLGKCHHSKNADDLKFGRNELETLQIKQMAISKYMFHLAFENTFEAGFRFKFLHYYLSYIEI